MKACLSPLMEKILSVPGNAEKLTRIVLREAEDNILEFEGKKYFVHDGPGHRVYNFYMKKKSEDKR